MGATMKTSSVLTPDEWRSYYRALQFNQDERVPQPFDGDVAAMHDIIDRLVAKVERLEDLLRRGTHPDDGMSRKWYDDVLDELEKP